MVCPSLTICRIEPSGPGVATSTDMTTSGVGGVEAAAAASEGLRRLTGCLPPRLRAASLPPYKEGVVNGVA